MDQQSSQKRRFIVFGAIFLLLLIVMPLVVFLTRKSQDIRPRALAGQANFLLSASNTNVNPNDEFTVVVTVQLSDSRLRVSGVDFLLKYDKEKLEVLDVAPQVLPGVTGAAFTDAPIISEAVPINTTTNGVRVAVVANKPDNQLAGGSVQVARITFRAKIAGSASLQFSENAQDMEVTGIQQ